MKYGYHRAVKAALHGPEVKKLKLAGDHEFNIKPFHAREDGASTVTVGGQISHCRSPWADEQIHYVIQAAKGRVAGFLASCYDGARFPFDLFELRMLDVALSDDALSCIDALRWGKADLCRLLPDGKRRLEALITTWGVRARCPT